MKSTRSLATRFPSIGWIAIAHGGVVLVAFTALLIVNEAPAYFLPAWAWAVLLLSLLVSLGAWADQSHPQTPPNQPAGEQRLPLPTDQVIDLIAARSKREAHKACVHLH